ncbi:ATP-dependent nuclease [Xanthomonas arboricola]|uniref:ATP-dependent nuclease n=1 Tax=Xanthomonas arboricola TaxID=56448 RepID=UPI0016179C2A|nr:ATP-binding protein [Xanthomonas arboricola]MBB3760801.1 putative ATPase [Xanthomonas arboricola]
MQLRRLKISKFRGIAEMEWTPGHTFCCLIGSGDSGKSTILDALEAALSSRWFSFSESDFFAGDTTNQITVEVTIGELSRPLKSDERFGFFVRGWTEANQLRDEPEADDEPVLTVRLTVDGTMEPIWELICDRTTDTRTLSNRDRALFGLVRLAGEDARHLTWGQGSVLSRLAGDTKEAASKLGEAYRAARASAKLDEIKSLMDASELAEGFAKGMGAYVQGSYGPGLELGRSGLSSGSILLHDSGVPLRLAGLGTRRLATLAIQKSAVNEGAIVLVDEIEHGLEPHRIIGAISQLKADQAAALAGSKPIGQVIMTTHSDVAVGEVVAESLRVVQVTRGTRFVTIQRPEMPDPLRALLRYTPRAFFARKILVCEGNTELGLLSGLREKWPSRHNGRPIEQLGAALADGNGGQAPEIALSLGKLGYHVALFRDSDVPLSFKDFSELAKAGIQVIEYGNNLNTEQAIFSAAIDPLVQALLELMRSTLGEDAVNNNISNAIPDLPMQEVLGDFSNWSLFSNLNEGQLRHVIAEVAEKKKWFKSQAAGRTVADLVWQIAAAGHPCPLSNTVLALEAWLYG